MVGEDRLLQDQQQRIRHIEQWLEGRYGQSPTRMTGRLIRIAAQRLSGSRVRHSLADSSSCSTTRRDYTYLCRRIR